MSNNHKHIDIYTDGAARGNPGPAACAFLLVQNNEITFKDSVFIGKSTNNIAEYKAIINALKYVATINKGVIHLYSDSNLAIQQINNKWKVKSPHLLKLRNEVNRLSNKFDRIQFFHIGRTNKYIQLCDKMCNERLDAEEIH